MNQIKSLKLAKFLIGDFSPVFIKGSYSVDVRFHPNEFTTSGVRGTRSFFKYILRVRSLLNFVSQTHSRFSGLHFFNVQNSSFKFRKRSNMYFCLSYTSIISDPFLFLTMFPNFIKLINMLSYRLFKVYNLRAGVLKIKLRQNTIDFYILNLHLLGAALNNKKIDPKNLIFKLSLRTSDHNLLKSLLRLIYRKNFFR